MFKRLALALCLVMTPAAADTPEVPLRNQGALDIVSDWVANRPPPPDPFSGPPVSPYVGRQVLLEFPLTGPQDDFSPFRWTFDRHESKLELSAFVSNFQHTSTLTVGGRFLPTLSGMHGFTLEDRRAPSGTAEMMNSYGAKVSVEVIDETRLGVASYSEGGRGWVTQAPASTFRYETHLGAEDARQLVPHLKFFALGKVVSNADGNPVTCGTHYSEATINRPRQVSGKICLLNVEWVGFAFVDQRTGTQLKTWGG